MIPDNRIPTHPGVILSQEFLAPLGITQVALAAHLGVPVQRINELVRGKRGVTPETAWLLAQALNTTPRILDQPAGGSRLGAQQTFADCRAPEGGELRPGANKPYSLARRA